MKGSSQEQCRFCCASGLLSGLTRWCNLVSVSSNLRRGERRCFKTCCSVRLASVAVSSIGMFLLHALALAESRVTNANDVGASTSGPSLDSQSGSSAGSPPLPVSSSFLPLRSTSDGDSPPTRCHSCRGDKLSTPIMEPMLSSSSCRLMSSSVTAP